MRELTRNGDQRVLLAAAQAGDERAFRQLVEPYRHHLQLHCYRILGSVHDAEATNPPPLRCWPSPGPLHGLALQPGP